MTARVAINGFGRIGRAFLRAAWRRPELHIVAINDLGDPENLAYLLKYDTVYGRFPEPVRVEQEGDTTVLVIGEDTRIGAAWRSSIKHELKGDAEFNDIDPVLQAAGFFVNTDASAEVKLPATLSLSAYHRFDDRWAVMGDVTWTQWSNFKELRIEYDKGSQGDTVQDESWEDTYRYAVGIHYRHSKQILLRLGAAYDQTPIPDAEHRTPRIPGNDRTWLAVGLNYRVTPQLSFDLGYAHLFVDDTRIKDRNKLGATLEGEFDSKVDILSGQVVWSYY